MAARPCRSTAAGLRLQSDVRTDLAARRIVPLNDQMRLRYLARRDEVTLPLEDIRPGAHSATPDAFPDTLDF